jgi:hypothetical protein
MNPETLGQQMSISRYMSEESRAPKHHNGGIMLLTRVGGGCVAAKTHCASMAKTISAVIMNRHVVGHADPPVMMLSDRKQNGVEQNDLAECGP